MSKDPYADFVNDEEAVNKGILINYGSFRVRVALVDDSNKPFTKLKTTLFKPLQHKVDTKTVRDEEVVEILQEAFASKGVLSWEVLDENTKDEKGAAQFVPGIRLPDGTIAEASKANILTVFAARERVFKDIYKQASDYTLFRKADMEAEKKTL